MSSTPYYPISMNLAGKPCVVVGGGSVAARKVSGLLGAGAEVTVISPKIVPALKNRVKNNSIHWIQDNYKKEYLAEMVLVFGATDVPEVNRQISLDAQSLGLPVNIADEPENCTFILPAICKKGDIQIAVNTGGSAPGIAAKIRNSIDGHIGNEYTVLVSLLKELRSRIKRIPQKARDRFWQRIKQMDIDSFQNNTDELTETVTAWMHEAERTGNQL